MGTAIRARVESPGSQVVSRAAPEAGRRRLGYLDNLKIGLVAGIIAAHAFNSYSEFGSWAYQPVREVSLSPTAESIFVIVISIASLFLMGLFFLISGLLTPPSLERKGTREFVRDRMVRLGVPLAAFTLLLWPLTIFAIREPFLHEGSPWWWFTHADPLLDNGPLWFIGVLLIYSLGYAGWRALRPEGTTERPGQEGGGRLRPWMLLSLGAAIAVASFILRLWFPMNSTQFLNLHLWEWPQCLGMFALGVMSARRGWLTQVSDRMRRGCGMAALFAAASLPVLIFTSDSLGLEPGAYFGGWGWPSLATSMVEGALTVGAGVWVLGFAQRRLSRPARPWLARSAYAAFLIQGPVLIGLALALRPLPLTGEVKAITLAITGVMASYALGRLLVTRTAVGRIL